MDVEREIVATLTDPDALATYQREGISARLFADERYSVAFAEAMGYYKTHGRMTDAPSYDVLSSVVEGFPDMVAGTSGAAPSFLANEMRRLYTARQVTVMLHDVMEGLQDDPVGAAKYLRDGTSRVIEMTTSADSRIVYGDDMSYYRQLASARDSVAGAPYPFPEMQSVTGGIRPGEMATLVGPSGMGKSMLAVKTALEAVRQGWNVYFATLELDPYAITQRMELMEANRDGIEVPVGPWREGVRLDRYVAAYEAAQERIAAMPGKLVVDQPRVEDRTPAALVNACKSLGCNYMIVDQLQFVTKPRRESLSESVGMVMQDFKQVLSRPADNVRVPMLLLHQMNRTGVKTQETGSGKIGSMTDIAHSSWIEQLSDVVWAIGRNREEGNLGIMNIGTLKVRNFPHVGWRLDWDLDVGFRIGIQHLPDGSPVRLLEW